MITCFNISLTVVITSFVTAELKILSATHLLKNSLSNSTIKLSLNSRFRIAFYIEPYYSNFSLLFHKMNFLFSCIFWCYFNIINKVLTINGFPFIAMTKNIACIIVLCSILLCSRIYFRHFFICYYLQQSYILQIERWLMRGQFKKGK